MPKGEAGDVTMPLLMTKNDNDTYREAIVTLHCGEKTVKITIHQNANPDAVHVMDPAKIANYDKFSRKVPTTCCAVMPAGRGGV